jgi:hypothetical protein
MATSQHVRRLDIAEFKAKSSGMTFALSLTYHDKINSKIICGVANKYTMRRKHELTHEAGFIFVKRPTI